MCSSRLRAVVLERNVTPLRGKLVVGLRWELEGKKEEKKKNKTSHAPAPLFPGPTDVSLNALQPSARFTSDLSVSAADRPTVCSYVEAAFGLPQVSVSDTWWKFLVRRCSSCHGIFFFSHHHHYYYYFFVCVSEVQTASWEVKIQQPLPSKSGCFFLVLI